MHASVAQQWEPLNRPMEGRVPFMYLDRKRLVTIGVGNLIDPMAAALTPDLPFRWKASAPGGRAGRPATRDEVIHEWKHVKSHTELASHGGGAFAKVTQLELTNDAIDRLVMRKLLSNETVLKSRTPFARFDDWPADAQFALLSMSWALGPAFRFPTFQKACEASDFDTAADECSIADGKVDAAVARRNRMNRQMFQNAAAVMDALNQGFLLSLGVLYYPIVRLKPIVL